MTRFFDFLLINQLVKQYYLGALFKLSLLKD
jgi:hypothetical protein